MKPSIQTITVKTLTNLLLILAVILLLITGMNFRDLSKTGAENQAQAHAELVKAGLTAHMKADIMDKRDYYLEEIRQLHQINRLQIIRGDEVTAQFGPGKDLEKTIDPIAKQAFETAQPVFILDEFSSNPTVRAIIPYIASKKGTLNCIICHKVEEGTVLGAVDIELDVTAYRNQTLVVLTGMLLISLVFLFFLLANISNTIQRYVKEPLEILIDKAMTAYNKHTPISSEEFSTVEFTNVANEINLFNSEVIAHQDLLEQKNKELIALNKEIESSLREAVYTMGVIEEQRSKETNNHTRRVTQYSRLLAIKLGLPEKDVDLITAASPLHDIGKLGVPDEILFKPGKLTDEEYKIMQNQTGIGYSMLQYSKRDILKAAGIIAFQHHEKWDGSGYPQGLKGEKINIYGRIVALSDVFDALFSSRVYKEAWDLEQVVNWITEQRGKHFDPALVDIFINCVDDFVAISTRYPADKICNKDTKK